MAEIKPDVYPAAKPLKRLKKEAKKCRRELGGVDLVLARRRSCRRFGALLLPTPRAVVHGCTH